MTEKPRVNSQRLWKSLSDISAFGAIEENGLNRLALSEEDRQARAFFVAQAKKSGYSVSYDAIGNILVLRRGLTANLPMVLTGSHLDSQPSAGRFDGTYGVLAGLEVLRTLDDFAILTTRPVGVACFTNEEGARFTPAMMGSSVLTGVFPLQQALDAVDSNGLRLGDELIASGFAGSGSIFGPADVHTAFELHIEQGARLEKEGLLLGAVTGIFGITWFEVQLLGPGGHSGTTPMAARCDPVVGAGRLIEAVARIGLAGGEEARATVGRVAVFPNSINSIASKAIVNVEFRCPGQVQLDDFEKQLFKSTSEIAGELGLAWSLVKTFNLAPVTFDPEAVETIKRAAKTLGLGCLSLSSGAGHDAGNLARLAPTAMIFIPCHDGLSHVPEENIEPQWAQAGANALLLSILEKAL
ncbi:MAG: M20 family metallo-hydrolase [Deltaproteobacteria bacterium]|jgi:N-carbamoyl-L-amino-acid hydrolase|nr:M20 family metallo-hydrolase [Deltaproteobacteria bacterium]